ncbi:MAG: TrmB family transcriptional regulator [Candidatus Woesearchaeota archaeon]
MDLSVLEEIGMTKGEIAVYLALLEIGSSTVGPIADKAKVSSSKIYDILERLIDKGLANYVIRENTKYFDAAQPNRILDYMQDKKKQIEDKEEKIKQMLPELELKQNLNQKKQEVNVYEGIKGIKTVREKSLREMKKGEEFYILGASAASNLKLGDYWMNYHRRRSQQKIGLKMLINRDAPKHHLDERNVLPHTDVKYMPFDASTPAWIEIYNERAVVGIAEDEPISIEIKSKKAAQSFRSYFEALWNQDTGVTKGWKAFEQSLNNMLDEIPQDGEYQVYGAAMGPNNSIKNYINFFSKFHKRRISKKINVRLLFYQDGLEQVNKYKKNISWFERGQIKFLNYNQESPVQVFTYNDKALLTIHEKEPTVIYINNKNIANSFRKNFENSWNQEVRILRGIDSMKILFNEFLEFDKVDMIAAKGYFIDKCPKFIDQWEKIAIKKKIKIRNIVDLSTRGHRITKFKFAETKYTLNNEFSELSVITIYGNKVVISNWTKEEPIIIIIENKEINEMYKKQFELLWKKENFK